MKPEPEIIDAEYRVLGEDRWAPFRRWCAEMRFKAVAAVLGERVAADVWWRQVLYVLVVGSGIALTLVAAAFTRAIAKAVIGS